MSLIEIQQEFTTKEALELIRHRTGRGTRTRLYEWLIPARVSREPKRYYTRRDVAKLIWFAQMLNRVRSVVVASQLLDRYLEALDEDQFIKQAFGE